MRASFGWNHLNLANEPWPVIRLVFNAFGVMVLMATATSLPAAAFCSQPSFYGSEPSPPGTYSKPDVPYCLSEYSWSGKHTCDEWEIDSYISEVNDYIRELNRYANEANEFAEEAIEFANESAAYAECEAQEVKSQHE